MTLTWQEKFKDNQINLQDIKLNKSWRIFLKKEFKKDYFKLIETLFQKCMDQNKCNMLPYPDDIYKAFNCVSVKKTKVVIIGQDPYHGVEVHNNKVIPQAMGLAFSVSDNIKIPSSLNNIYKNMIKFKHLGKTPKSGNLEYLAKQGILLLNTSLTVHKGTPGSHRDIWYEFTDKVITHLSKTKDNLIFVLWGSHALGKKVLIDETKHKVIISSHPSGLSCNKKLKSYPPFMDFNHFFIINKFLKKHKIKRIVYDKDKLAQ